MTGVLAAAWVLMGVGLVAYVLTGGADFGGGTWDLLASGPRKAEQRRAIEHAIAPIWEANHVWLIFVIVLMFTAFPRAFSAIGISLHIPISLALVGIVLRGAAFSFRAYGLEPSHVRERWGHVFAWASSVTPIFLGATLGALSTGDIRLVPTGGDPHAAVRVTTGFFAGWTTPFAVLVGVFALVLFAMLAGVYLSAETSGDIREDFRKRAIGAELAGAVIAALVLWRAAVDAPELFRRLIASAWTIPIQGGTALAAAVTIGALATRRFKVARISVAAQVALVVLGWGLAMDGNIVLPDLPVTEAGARDEILRALLPALLGGAVLLVPSLFYLMRVFKGSPVRR